MNGNIQAEAFSDEIKQQISIRQDKLGIISGINDDIITWYNAKTAWCRMISSVDVNGSSDLAKNHVLFGGTTSYQDNSWFFKSGFDDLSNVNSTYNKTEYGFKPIPSITKIQIDYVGGDDGSVARGEIGLKVYSPEQLDIIDKLYMKLGYHVLIEWGHTMYLNNKGEKINFTDFNTLPFEQFFNPKSSNEDDGGDGVAGGKNREDTTYLKIDEETKKHCGNYGAFLGTIYGFNWSFNSDGSYNVTIRLKSQGAVVESLKANISLNENNSTTTNQKDNKPVVEFLKDISKFNKFLYDITILNEGEIKNKYDLIDPKSKIIKKEFVESVGWAWTRQTNVQYYITLGGLLEYMENNINIFSNNKKLIIYDYSNENYCLTFNGHFAADPRICLIPVGHPEAGNLQSDLREFKNPNNPYVGNLMYLLVNVNFLSSILVSLRDEKNGNVTVYEFLNLILLKINNTLGGINKLELFYNEGTLKILENAPLRYDNLRKNNKLAELNLYGVSPEQGSFVENVDFNITIGKDLAASVVIGAAANGNQPGINSTAVSQYNKGLIDRIFPEKFTIKEDVGANEVDESKTRFKNTLNKIVKCLTSIYTNKNLSDETIKLLETLNNDYSDYIIGKYSESKQIPAPFFLPFNLELTLDGISGIKVRQAFAISTTSAKILPSFCRDGKGNPSTNFLAIDVSHQIENNKWKSKIRSITAPIDVPAPLTTFEEKTQIISPEKITAISCKQEATISLSPNYNLAQLSCAALAAKYSLPVEGEQKTTSRGNFNRQQIIDNLKDIAINVLEPIKAKYPTLLVTSGYRNKGGNSQHEIGQAVDLQFTDIVGPIENQNTKILQRAKDIKSLLGGYDQFLLEYKTDRGRRPWIHISWAKNNRGESGTFLNDSYASSGRNNFYNPLA